MNKRVAAFLLASIVSIESIAQLPTLPTDSRLLSIPKVEVVAGEAKTYYTVQLQASEDFSTWSLASAAEVDLSYDRDDWKHWEDFDSDCQNTRHELLIASSSVPVTFTSSTNCTVFTGQWVGPYTGGTYTLASDLDIDHVIPLKYAHDHGGAIWSAFVKKLFANDPDNLLAVDDGQNQSKSAKGPGEWMPPDESNHCEYARKWSFLAAKYELNLALVDSQKLDEVLQGC